MSDYSIFVERIKSRFNKAQLKIFDHIQAFDTLQLASSGSNDTEGYQIFTPDFVVKDMCSSIGKDILDFAMNILEPTSGDGAFTTFILSKRLETIKDNYEFSIIKALSTLYSIEMDNELITKQRNNIFTVVKLFLKKKKIEASESFFDLIKCIITTNFVWAMFNSDSEIDFLGSAQVAYAMPNAEKKQQESSAMDFPVWDINDETIDFHMEGVDLW